MDDDAAYDRYDRQEDDALARRRELDARSDEDTEGEGEGDVNWVYLSRGRGHRPFKPTT
jgi:hypothetical protein